MAADDVSIDDSALTQTGISQDTLDNIESVFAQSDASPEPGLDAVAPPPKADDTRRDPPRSMTARRAEAKQQAEELAEEGLEGGEEKPAAEDAEADEPAEDEGSETDETEQPATPEVDEGLRAIAKEFGWTDERIDRLAAKDPELLNETLDGLAEAYNNLSRSYLAPGPQQAAAQPALQPAQQASGLDALFAPKNLQAFAEANGEELVEKFLKPLYHEMIVPVREMQAAAQVQMQQALAAEAGTAFGKLSEKDSDLYGSGTALTPQQIHARNKVAVLADQMRAGASMQGRNLSVSEAIQRAHLAETAERRRAEGRQQVQQAIQKRSKSLTARPTQRSSSPAGKAPLRGESRAAEAYSLRAAELGIEV